MKMYFDFYCILKLFQKHLFKNNRNGVKQIEYFHHCVQVHHEDRWVSFFFIKYSLCQFCAAGAETVRSRNIFEDESWWYGVLVFLLLLIQ